MNARGSWINARGRWTNARGSWMNARRQLSVQTSSKGAVKMLIMYDRKSIVLPKIIKKSF